MEKILEAILAFLRKVFGSERFIFVQFDGTGKIGATITRSVPFRLIRVELHIGTAPSTSQDFTITRGALKSTRYDVVYYKRDLSVGGVVDLIIPFGKGYEFPAGTELDIAYTNTDARTWGLEVVIELLEG